MMGPVVGLGVLILACCRKRQPFESRAFEKQFFAERDFTGRTGSRWQRHQKPEGSRADAREPSGELVSTKDCTLSAKPRTQCNERAGKEVQFRDQSRSKSLKSAFAPPSMK